MKSKIILTIILFLFGGIAKTVFCQSSESTSFLFQKNKQNKFGISISRENKLVAFNENPINFEIYDGDETQTITSGYDSFSKKDDVVTAKGKVKYKKVLFVVLDQWRNSSESITITRHIEVRGEIDGGFMSGIFLNPNKSVKRDSVLLFAPGMIYGATDYLPERAIGGIKAKDFIWIREDRLPAPLLGLFFNDGNSISILNSKPDARTTKEDSRAQNQPLLINDKFNFGAVAVEFVDENPSLGYCYPGSEGAISYGNRTYRNGGSTWTKRYNPIKDGFVQNYKVSFRFANDNTFAKYYSGAWRWAWSMLKPKVNYQNIELAKQSLMNVLNSNIETHGQLTGIRNFISPVNDSNGGPFSIFGFTGKAIETANYMLQYSLDGNNPLSEEFRKKGEAIIESFMKLKMSPPEGEGINLLNGNSAVAIGNSDQVYLRSFGDGLKALLKAVKREKELGIDHPDWLNWAKSFADWLLPQQYENGGFPRSWEPGTGKVVVNSPQSSYNAIPFLVLLTELTGDNRYLEAAKKAGDFCWNTTHSKGLFIGGTIDNPNVLDKEAGTLSLEAYLTLFHYTSDSKWLERAEVAGNFAETWIYIWDIPMPYDENDEELHWKKGVSNIGLQLISTGHSGADQYMAFDVNEYADLYLNTKNAHYYQVAMILLHNTKAMLALPGREFGMKGPGWQQEYWSMSPPRGMSRIKGWLPWVATSQLNGIFELEELNEELYQEMIKK
jgi:hypothetical protein